MPGVGRDVNIRNNINDCSTEFKNNVIPVAAAYCLTGDVRYKNRVWSELENVGIIISKGTSGRFVTESNESIEQSRNKLAKKIVCDFIKNTNSLSLTKEQVISMIEEVAE